MRPIPLTKANARFAFAELDWTHDYSGVKVGSLLISRHGIAREVTAITVDSAARKQYWSNTDCLATQYHEPHNMLTKSPFYAYQYKGAKLD